MASHQHRPVCANRLAFASSWCSLLTSTLASLHDCPLSAQTQWCCVIIDVYLHTHYVSCYICRVYAQAHWPCCIIVLVLRCAQWFRILVAAQWLRRIIGLFLRKHKGLAQSSGTSKTNAFALHHHVQDSAQNKNCFATPSPWFCSKKGFGHNLPLSGATARLNDMASCTGSR